MFQIVTEQRDFPLCADSIAEADQWILLLVDLLGFNEWYFSRVTSTIVVYSLHAFRDVHSPVAKASDNITEYEGTIIHKGYGNHIAILVIKPKSVAVKCPVVCLQQLLLKNVEKRALLIVFSLMV